MPEFELTAVEADKSQIPFGYCHCGCGKKTKICSATHVARGRVKGKPFRYIQGHAPRKFHAEYKFDPKIGYGKCHCGCGADTPIATDTHAAYQRIKGKPLLFIYGHTGKKEGQEQYVVDPATGCWVWQWSKTKKGYASTHDGPGHVIFYEAAKGPVPQGMQLDHTCRNRACVNPDHLEPVTCVENVRRGLVPVINIEIARQIKETFKTVKSPTKVARLHGVTYAIADNINRGKTWRDA